MFQPRLGDSRPWWRTALATIFLVLFGLVVALSACSTHQDEISRLSKQMMQLQQAGKYEEAIPIAEHLAERTKKSLGESHPDYATSLNNLAELYRSMGDYARAEPLYRQALEIWKKSLGEAHPSYATSLNNLALLYESMGDYARAEPLCRQALETLKKSLGEAHPSYATSLNNLAGLYQSMGDYARAEPLYRQALEIRKKVLGESHPDYAASLNNMALLYESMGNYASAEPLYRQALETLKKSLGEAHPDYAQSLNNLAGLYESMGNYASAEPLYRQALEIWKKSLGESHPDYAQSLNNLAALYRSMGDYARAEPLLRQALEIRKKAPGEAHPDYATSLHNLAFLYESMGDYARAEPLDRQAIEIEKKALGESHPDYAKSLHNLALLYQSMGDYARAEPLDRQALEILKKSLGEAHPAYASSLNNLAQLYQSMGDYARAEPLYRQALKIKKKALGEAHPYYATSLNNLAMLYEFMGDYTRAEPFYQQALQIVEHNLELTSAAQSERQQFAMARSLRSYLDGYLSLTAQASRPGAAAYQHALAWKGAVLGRQLSMRGARRSAQEAPTWTELDATARRLAALSFATPTPQQRELWQQQIRELAEKKERLEADLSGRSATFREQRRLERLTPEDMRRALPPATALIDVLEYWHMTPPAKKGDKPSYERRLVAFVLRSDRALKMVALGPAEKIAAAVGRWRETLGAGASGTEAGAELRRLVWQPLEAYLEGASTVLISPDGTLARLPWAALPGSEPGRYILEERTVGVVAVPRLLAANASVKAGEIPAQASLLALGDVGYEDAPGQPLQVAVNRAAARGAEGRLSFARLENTGPEVDAVCGLFGRVFPKGVVKRLLRVEATEERLREEAPRYRYLHLATHGFFAAPAAEPPSREGSPTTGLLTDWRPSVAIPASSPAAGGPAVPASVGAESFGRAAVVGFLPGLMTGLALAGANRPPDPRRDDGILTALEVAALDLSGTDLVVLSACETGLGREEGGEGLLGLQRAFQVAGAHAVVASLWNVNDDATRRVMERFYRNLWGKKMPKLEALRQAQLWMLREGAGVKEGAGRGVTVADEKGPESGSGRLPPADWAGFVLSGDWR